MKKMKKILLLGVLGLTVNVFAQSTIQVKDHTNNVLLAPNDTVYVATTAETNFKIELDIKNTDLNSTHRYTAIRYNAVLNAGASAYFCFAGSCYGDQTFISPNSLTLTGGQSASDIAGTFNTLVTDLDEGPVAGLSIIKYSFINVDNMSDSVQVSIRYNAAPSTVGIKESSKNLNASFGIFPNPAKETTSLLVNAVKATESSVQLFNSLGEVVYQKNVNLVEGKNKIEVSLENLASGVYFANLKTENGNVSKKLIVTR